MNSPEFCFLTINWWPLCMQKGEWASWVQAVFSVVAIGAAIWLGHRTDAKAREGARNHLLMFKSSTKSAIRAAMMAANEQDRFGYTLGRAMIHDAIHLGQAVSLHLLSRHNSFVAMRYRAVLSTAGAAVERDPSELAWGMIEFMHKAQALGELLEDLQRVDELKAPPNVDDWVKVAK